MLTKKLSRNTPAPPINAHGTLISTKEACRRAGNRSRWWLRDEYLAGRFPPPVRVGRCAFFVEAEVEQWLQARFAERPSNPSAGGI